MDDILLVLTAWVITFLKHIVFILLVDIFPFGPDYHVLTPCALIVILKVILSRTCYRINFEQFGLLVLVPKHATTYWYHPSSILVLNLTPWKLNPCASTIPWSYSPLFQDTTWYFLMQHLFHGESKRKHTSEWTLALIYIKIRGSNRQMCTTQNGQI